MGAILGLTALLVTLEVILRRAPNISIGGADAVSGYAFGVATALALSSARFERPHICIDALMDLSPMGPRPLITLFGRALLIGFALVVVAMVWTMVADTLEYGSHAITPKGVPLAIPRIPWLPGWMFFVFAGVLIAAVGVQRIARRDKAGVRDLIGIKSLDEQIKGETVRCC